MTFYFTVCGYGVSFQIGGYDGARGCFVILAWAILKDHIVWRGETHSRGVGDGYWYTCYKNGIVVEKLSFRSPVVSYIA